MLKNVADNVEPRRINSFFEKNNCFPLIKFSLCGIIAENVPRTVLTPSLYSGGNMKKIGLFLFAAVMSLLAVSCRDVLLEKNIGGFSVSFQTPESSSRAGATATWKLEAWLELEGGAQLQKKNDTVPANAPITISFDAVPIGTKLKVQVRLEDSENQFIQHEGSSDWITVDAESKTVVVQVQRMIINAAAPTITTQPESQNNRSEAGSDAPWTVTLRVEATSPDGGNLSYQWYENTANSNSGGKLISGATKENYQVTLNPGETKYFYCKVTNINDGVNGTKDATITSEVAELVYNNIAQSGVLLWKSTDSSVKIAPYENLNSGSSSKLPSNLQLPLFWCFDNTGNLYWSAKGRTTAWCYNLQSDESYKLGDSYSSSLSLSALSYDNVASILYGITGNGITKLTTSSSDQIIKFDGNGITPIGFAVHNGIAYVAAKINEGENGAPIINVKSFNLNADANSIAGIEKSGSPFTLPSLFGNNAPITSQMIYQDGALYLLLSSFTVSSAINESATEVYSCGALVKINPSTLTLDTSFGDNGYLGLVSGRASSGTYIGSTYNQTLYSPTESDEGVAFYGPVGFVAVMPKKLVIGDAGYTLSNKAEGGLLAGRKCRVVTVDLETQAFAVTSLDDKLLYRDVALSCGFLEATY